MADDGELPDVRQVLGPILARVPRDRQPLLIALAERLAAERYRRWADEVARPELADGLRACAACEEEIASQVEALYPGAAAVQREIMAQNPDLLEVNRTLFAPLPLARQLVLQARAERLGAATWRAFARHAEAASASETFLRCALLEEESAAFLESITEALVG